MTNEQIILNEAAKLDPATLHAIATAHHTPEQIAAIAAKATTTDDDGNEKPASVADVEIILAAQQLHTIAKWNSLNKRIRTGEKSLITCYLWKYTTKPSKEQREAAEAEGKEAAPAPHFYPTKSYLFSCLQVEDAKAAPAARFGSVAEIMAYNKKLAAERKAAKIDLDKLYTLYTAEYSRLYNSDDPDDTELNAPEQPAPAPAPAPVVIEERHELPELVHVDPLPKKPAKRTTTKPKSNTAALKQTERKAKAAFLAVPETDRKAQAEALSAWRKARKDVAEAENAPAADVQQLDFASLAAGLLA